MIGRYSINLYVNTRAFPLFLFFILKVEFIPTLNLIFARGLEKKVRINIDPESGNQ
jgi:hypothetical protein